MSVTTALLEKAVGGGGCVQAMKQTHSPWVCIPAIYQLSSRAIVKNIFENYLLTDFKNHAPDLAPVLALVVFPQQFLQETLVHSKKETSEQQISFSLQPLPPFSVW